MTTDDTIDRLLAELTLDEKASLTAGVTLWYLPAIARLGIPALKVSDGPSGVRGDSLIGRRSLSLPCGMAVGSTWNTALVGRLGDVLAAEAVSKNVHVLLGPTVCIVRQPLAGRTFESFSEDPLLTSRLAVAYVEGVQAGGVACCIKHFACNDQEHERMTISAVVDERTLHEVHLPAFEAAVDEADVGAVMTAYNRVNGIYCGEQPDLITRVLRRRWGFEGLVMSDWFGTHSTADAARAGLDLEMPGPSAWLGPTLAAAVRDGTVDESVVDEQVRHLFGLMARVGILPESPQAGHDADAPEHAPEREEDEPWRRAVARQVATEGTVMLTNRNLLPLTPANLVDKTVAVIGANAGLLEMGGGSSEVTPHRRRRVIDALAERLPGANLVYEEGCRIDKGLATIDMRLLAGDGFTVEYFTNTERSGLPVASERAHNGRMSWVGTPHPSLDQAGPAHSLRISGQFTPDVSGTWELGLESAGRSVLLLDGEQVIDNTEPQRGSGFFGAGSTVVTIERQLEAGVTHEVVMEVWPRNDVWPILGARLAAGRPHPDDAFERAVAAAAAAEVAVVVVGLNGAWESEGFDRPDLSLPGRQRELVEAVLAVNEQTIVVVNAGSPVDLPWAEQAGAVLVCWYPGEEGADALADIVVGLADPGGRLPVSWPVDAEDGATGESPRCYPGVDGQVVYDEGVMVGYRHFTTMGIEPRFCFGHGLTYGEFHHSDVHTTSAGIAIEVNNVGARTGTMVVQVYLRAVESAVVRPDRQLIGFEKVTVEPGQRELVEIPLDEDSFRYWDVETHAWRTDPGPYQLLIGASSEDIWATADITLGVG
jgi:beta-glucosidase